ncbi:MAG: amidophosphoribosyltransferase [Eubacteriales bacterium]|jgi:amidophosphoribosyltransferase|nr:amidophosphoribosyltransferase [Eubacteriales bacterium]NLO14617.1 amidophosphoribosyltransferase [Clostridiales bacterium]
MAKLYEECGIFGISRQSNKDVALDTYFALNALQHRGQESCGMVVSDGRTFNLFTAAGVVSDVVREETLAMLGEGSLCIGHVRYGSDRERGLINAQPVVVDHLNGRMALANNGALVNYMALRREYEAQGSIFHSTGDAEVIASAVTHERLRADSLEQAVLGAMNRLRGSYSMVIMTPEKLIAVRDPLGLKPLCFGQREDGAFIVASESCALDAVGAEFIRDLKPGEMLVFENGVMRAYLSNCTGDRPSRLCAFEYIYFARPDSVMDGQSVHDVRLRAGERLANEHPTQADLVIGVPDSGIDAAIGFARASKIPYGLGFIKSKYIARTFISPDQESRERGVRIKLNVIAGAVRGKRVILVDDSIVRGTTSRKIVALLREAGATGVHMRVTAPPFLNPCFYGTDIKSRENLIACKLTVEEIAREIGADSLGYLSVDGLKALTGEKGPGLCAACFDGRYPTNVPQAPELERIAGRPMRTGETI